ncbi:hypothetical protein [Phenylobacterium sp.]|uniref:TolB family protein n=1 Tax=Phenylobacterium sp. TaxID=1871053 RepID=UPI0025F043D8|nr:hypothetical protein [Phenylobacterium sp.]
MTALRVLRRLCAAAVLGLAALGACAQASPPAWADFRDPRPVAILGYAGEAMEPFLSRDGATLFFNNRNGPHDQTDIHWAERVDDLTFRYRGPVAGANSAALDGVPTMSRTGRFCFISTRAYRQSLATVHCGAWSRGQLTGVTLQTEASVHIPGRLVFDVEIDAAGERLILADGRFDGGAMPATADLRQARWADGEFRLWPADDRLFAAINTGALEYAPALSADGRLLAFTRLEGHPPLARLGVWIARRETPDAAFGPPVRLDAIAGFVEGPTFSPAGDAIYYHRREAGHFSLWRVTLATAAR